MTTRRVALMLVVAVFLLSGRSSEPVAEPIWGPAESAMATVATPNATTAGAANLDGVIMPVAHRPAAPAGSEAEAALIADRIDAAIEALNANLLPSQVERIRRAILHSSAQHGLDPLLVTAMMKVESTGRPGARSPKGALGLMQVMPYMIGPMELAGNPSTIEANIEASCTILAGNIRRLGEADGISAYFWGSDIRGTGYLERVQNAREWLARDVRS